MREYIDAQLLGSCPVPGRPGDNLPTTADVHLYADPLTATGRLPILYADSEGMSGGEKTPRGLEFHGRKVKNILKDQIGKPLGLTWASDEKTRSREFSVKNLFPKILYTFSDIIVFVLHESK